MDNFSDANFQVAVAGLREPEDPTLALFFFFLLSQISPLLFLRAPAHSL